jgi:predicted transcriptional regulator
MAATSLKLPENLKRRIEELASAANKTPHAFMVEALAREAERSELRARFADEAARSEEEAFSSGKAYELGATFDYLTARASGAKTRRPRVRAWQRSK